MKNAIKRAITCIAAGAALAIPFTTKVSADELEAVCPDTVPVTQAPAASTETPQTTQSEQSGQQEQSAQEPEQTPTVAAPVTDPAANQPGQEDTAQPASEPAMQNAAETDPEPTDDSIGSEEVSRFAAVDSQAMESEGNLPTGGPEEESPVPEALGLNVGGTDLGQAGVDSGWNSQSGKGWRYDGQSISMVNNDTAVDVHAEGQGIELSAAGFNRIGTLYADGDVNITGTGILLIDTIDMLEGTRLNLLTNTAIYEDGAGSVAVFARQEDGSYLLINGSVNGILDDTYSIPADVHLVIPKDSSLDMRVLDCVKEVKEYQDGSTEQTVLHYGIQPDDDIRIGSGGAVYRDGEMSYTYRTLLELSFPTLTIEDGASLTIAQDGVLKMGTTGYKKADADHIREVATLAIKGILELFGKIIGPSTSVQLGSGEAVEAAPSDLIPTVLVQENGSVQGSGSFSFVDIQYEETVQAQNSGSTGIHTGNNCRVVVKGKCPTVYAEGKNLKIIYGDGACMDGIVLADQSDVSASVYPFRMHDRLNLLSEPVDPEHRLDTRSAEIFVNGSVLYGDIEQARQGLHPSGWLFPVTANTYSGGGCSFSALAGEGSHGGKYEYFSLFGITPDTLREFNAGELETISFSDLQNVLDPRGELHADFRITYLTKVAAESGDGENQASQFKIETAVLTKNSTQAIPREAVCGIEMLLYDLHAAVAPASGGIGTSKTNTGAGVLGGSNAGSLTGGAYTSILSGTRTNKPPVEDPDPSGTPDAPGNSNDTPNNPGSTNDTPDAEDDPSQSDPTAPADTPADPDDTGDTPADPEDAEGGEDVPDDADAASADDGIYLDVRVNGTGTHFTVNAYLGPDRLQTLNGGTVRVTFRTDLPNGWNTNGLFAVFRNADGTVTAIKAYYDPATGTLSFDTPILGEFDLIYLHWEGDDYESDAFYAAVAEFLSRNA